MPLRSVEAASRDDAIAAAREQFGPQARVVGVRRVRSGGVLGFFATERYVAEVAEPTPETTLRPAVPARGRADADLPADFSSPLASASPARARAAAPARNGAAAWAAEAAARSTDVIPDDIPEEVRAAAAAARAARSAAAPRSAAPARTATAAAPSRNASLPAARPADDDRVSELVGLLAAQQSESAAPAYSRATFPRASFPRTGAVARSADTLPDDDEETGSPVRGAGQRLASAAPAAPSPFTAALARMVSGDQEVRQAVQDALAQPTGTRPRDDAEPWPVRPQSVDPAQTSVPSPVAHQEEETVGDQVIAPPSTIDGPVEVRTWAAVPEVIAASVSPREEAIADLLRGALAQGHSDEALAGILRRVLAGASPQTALPEPAAPAEPVFAVPTLPVPPLEVPVPAAVEPPVMAESHAAEPITPAVTTAAAAPRLPETPAAAPVAASVAPEVVVPDVTALEAVLPEAVLPEAVLPEAVLPEAVLPEAVAPAPVLPEAVTPQARITEPEVTDTPLEAPAPSLADSSPVTVDAPVQADWTPSATPVVPATSTDSMWGTPSSSAPLWGEPVSVGSAAPARSDSPIWAEVAPTQEPVATPLFPPAPVEDAAVQTPTVEAPAPEAPVLEAPVLESPVIESPVIETPAAETPAAEAPVVAAPAAEDSEAVRSEAAPAPVDEAEAVATDLADEQVEEEGLTELAPVLARTASDPAPMMSLDATTVMPPLSLLPPLPSSRGRGRPPVPPAAPRPGAPSSTRSSAPAPATDAAEPESTESLTEAVGEPSAPTPPVRDDRWLATVTRLPVAPLMARPQMPELPEDFDDLDAEEQLQAVRSSSPSVPAAEEPAPAPVAPEVPAPRVSAPGTVASAALAPGDVAARLELLGLPRELLGPTFADDVAERGTYAALTRSMALRLPQAPELPSGAGEAVFVVGPGVDALRAARSLAASLRLDPDRVQWATRGDLAGLAPKGSRVTTIDAAIDRRQESVGAGTVTIVAVDAPLRSDAYWMAQMMSIWTPVAVWAVVDATRKPEDLLPWIDAITRVDALIVQDTDLSADPAAVLRRVDAPVAVLDGVRATPHRWASLLCERLDDATT